MSDLPKASKRGRGPLRIRTAACDFFLRIALSIVMIFATEHEQMINLRTGLIAIKNLRASTRLTMSRRPHPSDPTGEPKIFLRRNDACSDLDTSSFFPFLF